MKSVRNILSIALVFVLLVGSCGKSRRLTTSLPDTSPQTPASTTSSAEPQWLTDALSELDALPTPEGVDAAVFSQLKDALREALCRATPCGSPSSAGGKPPPYKIASKPPTGEANRVDDLTLIDNGDGTYTLTWSYRNTGDYNQDGIVNIMDITPLAAHFNESVAEHPETEPIDGNGDGVITILDITPLAANFFTDCAGYSVEGAPSEFSEFSEVDRAPFVYEEGLSARKGFEYILSEEDVGDNFWFRVLPYDSEGKTGEASDAARRPFIPGNPPEIGSIGELAGDSGSAQVFTEQVSGDTPISYRIDFAGGAEPNEITGVVESYEGDYAEVTKNITLSRGGDLLEPTKVYPARLTVSNPSGTAIQDFFLSVTAWWHIQELPPLPRPPDITDDHLTALKTPAFTQDGDLTGVYDYWRPGDKNYIVFAQLKGEAWQAEVAVAGHQSPKTSLLSMALNCADSAGICWGDYSDGAVHFAAKRGGEWQHEVVAPGALFAPNTEVFFDSQDRAVIDFSYITGEEDGRTYKIARQIPEAWEVFDHPGGCVALRPNDNILVAYNSQDDKQVWLAERVGMEWEEQPVYEAPPEKEAAPTAVVLASDGLARIVIKDWEDGAFNVGFLMAREVPGGSFEVEPVEGYPDWSTFETTTFLALLPDGSEVLLFSDSWGEHHAVLAWCDEGIWCYEDAPVTGRTETLSLLVHPEGYPVIVMWWTPMASYW